MANQGDGVVPSQGGREGEGGVRVSEVGGLEGDVNDCLRATGWDGSLNMKVCIINLREQN